MKNFFCGASLLSLALSIPAMATEGTGSGAGPAHPAPGFCMDQGGISTTYEATDGGQIGICRLKDNSLIEEMTFWRQAQMLTATEAAVAFRKSSWEVEQGPYETWADVHCRHLGGTTALYRETLRPTATVTLCEFADRSAIETWTLLGGASYYPRLAELIPAVR